METRTARNAANGLFVVSVLVFLFALYVGLVFYENTIDLGAKSIAGTELFTWFLIFVIVLLLLFVGLLILYFTSPKRREGGAPAAEETYDTAPLPMDERFENRPFEPEAEVLSQPDAWAAPPIVDAEADALVVRCTNCSTEYELPYTTERPIVGHCPSCGLETVLEEDERVLATGGDPAIEIEGIGPVFAQKLHDAGVHTTEQLRAASTQRLAQEVGVPRHQVEQWQGMADLIRLRGIGKQLAELLVRAGVPNAKALSKETPARLVSKVQKYLASVDNPPTKARIDAKRARKLIDLARSGKLDKGKGLH